MVGRWEKSACPHIVQEKKKHTHTRRGQTRRTVTQECAPLLLLSLPTQLRTNEVARKVRKGEGLVCAAKILQLDKSQQVSLISLERSASPSFPGAPYTPCFCHSNHIRLFRTPTMSRTCCCFDHSPVRMHSPHLVSQIIGMPRLHRERAQRWLAS